MKYNIIKQDDNIYLIEYTKEAMLKNIMYFDIKI